MKLYELGRVIAERQFSWASEQGEERIATVKIGMPQQFPDSADYFVPYVIQGLEDEPRLRYAGGIDAIQALQGVLVLIGADLFALNRDCNGCLRWIGDSSGGLGFPVPGQ